MLAFELGCSVPGVLGSTVLVLRQQVLVKRQWSLVFKNAGADSQCLGLNTGHLLGI